MCNRTFECHSHTFHITAITDGRIFPFSILIMFFFFLLLGHILLVTNLEEFLKSWFRKMFLANTLQLQTFWECMVRQAVEIRLDGEALNHDKGK